MDSSERRDGIAIRLSTGAGIALAVATLVAFLDRLGWPLSLAVHFRAQYLIGSLFVAAVLVLVKRRRFALVLAGIGLLNLLPLAPRLLAPAPRPEDGPTLRMVLANIHTTNRDDGAVLDFLRDAEADLVLLLEVDAWWLDRLRPLRQTHPHGIELPRDDHFGIALFSAVPAETRRVSLGDWTLPAIVADLEWEGGPLRLVGVHAVPPVSGANARHRDRQLAEAAALLLGRPGEALIAGDLNLTPWSFVFNRLESESGLLDGGRGSGLKPTWPTRRPHLWIPIDHVLHSAGLRTVGWRRGPHVGSDHYPLVIDLQQVERK